MQFLDVYENIKKRNEEKTSIPLYFFIKKRLKDTAESREEHRNRESSESNL